MDIKYFDAFSGIGGFSLGIEQAHPDWECVGFSDIEKNAISIYKYHFKGVKNYGDISKIDTSMLPDFDLLTFGFPCQDVSLSGKRAGLTGKRSGLFSEALKLLKNKNPHYFIFENVPGLLSCNNGKDFEYVCEELYKIGYIFDFDILNTSWYLPQNRARIYCIGVEIKWILNIIETGQIQRKDLLLKIIQGFLLSKLQQNLIELVEPWNIKLISYTLEHIIMHNLMLNGQKMKLKYWEIILGLDLHHLKNLYQDIQSMILKQKEKSADWLEKEYPHIQVQDILLDMKEERERKFVLLHIEKLLKMLSEENLTEMKWCIMSIWIKKIVEKKTYTYAEIENSIWLCIDKLKHCYPNLWKEALSNLIKNLGDKNYANNKSNKTENEKQTYYALFPISSEEGEEYNIKGYSGKKCSTKILPLRELNQEINGVQGQSINSIIARYRQSDSGGSYIVAGKQPQEEKVKMINLHEKRTGEWGNGEKENESFTLDSGCGRDLCIQSDEKDLTQFNEIEVVDDGASSRYQNKMINKSPALKATRSAYKLSPVGGNSQCIRRLTPIECEKLQGFPENFTKYGINEKGEQILISDNARYHALGNAISVPIVKDIVSRIKE